MANGEGLPEASATPAVDEGLAALEVAKENIQSASNGQNSSSPEYGAEQIQVSHLAEAIQYRTPDRSDD